jgi:hypothetical protein
VPGAPASGAVVLLPLPGLFHWEQVKVVEMSPLPPCGLPLLKMEKMDRIAAVLELSAGSEVVRRFAVGVSQ